MLYEKKYRFFGLIPYYETVTDIEKLEEEIMEIKVTSAFEKCNSEPLFNSDIRKIISSDKPARFIIEGK